MNDPTIDNLGPVAPGSVLTLTMEPMHPDADPSSLRAMAARLRVLVAEKCGHDDFALVVLLGGTTLDLAPSEDCGIDRTPTPPAESA